MIHINGFESTRACSLTRSIAQANWHSAHMFALTRTRSHCAHPLDCIHLQARPAPCAIRTATLLCSIRANIFAILGAPLAIQTFIHFLMQFLLSNLRASRFQVFLAPHGQFSLSILHSIPGIFKEAAGKFRKNELVNCDGLGLPLSTPRLHNITYFKHPFANLPGFSFFAEK